MPDRSDRIQEAKESSAENELPYWVEMLRDADSRVDGPLTMRSYDEYDYELSSQNIKYRAGSWSEAKEIAGIQETPKNYTRKQKEVNEDYFNEIDSESAYWLGFLIGDGSVYKHNATGNYCVTLRLAGKDIDHVRKFADDIEADYSISSTEPNFGISITNEEFALSLIELGCGPDKTTNGGLPELGRLDNHLIRGYSDADGSLRPNPEGGFRWQITAKNRERLIAVKDRVPFGEGVIRKNTQKDAYSLNYERIEFAEPVVDFLYPDGRETEPSLERKMDDVSRWL